MVFGTAFGGEPAPAWQAVPIVGAETVAAGFHGGEGAQVLRALAVSVSEPDFLLMGTDVGGIYRSLDAGRHWQVCMSGWDSRGANAFAIDPRDARRVVGVGGNSGDAPLPCNGLFLSTDRGASWRHVLPLTAGNDARASLVCDPSSYDPALGYCRVYYFDSRDGGLFKSTDGGEHWSVVNPDLSHCRAKVHPTKGYVYLASNENPGHGFYRSTDGGLTFRCTDERYVTGVDVSAAAPDNVWLSRWDKVQVSTDAGETFHYAGSHYPIDGLPEGVPIRDVTVSPANPRNMACWYDAGDWKSPRFFTVNGGQTWQPSDLRGCAQVTTTAGKTVPGTPLPYNQRGGLWAYDPAHPAVVFSSGGDWITCSTDAGATFAWSNDGANAVMVGASFNFNSATPDALFLSFQDYNGASTPDGGRTWQYHDVSGNGWGGFEYGGFALSRGVLWTGDAAAWGAPRRLKVSLDGGATWHFAQDAAGQPIVWSGPDVSHGDPQNPAVGFASNWRTADGSKTWRQMKDCDAVFCANPAGARELYGHHGDAIVCSHDSGQTWQPPTGQPVIPGGITDLAFDPAHARFWIVSQDVLKRWEAGVLTTVDIPPDQYGRRRVSSVVIDPVDSDLVYAGSHADLYACDNAVVRSTDGGATWVNLTRPAPLVDPVSGGPHEVQWLRVHPRTRELWVSGQCYGVWKIPAPTLAKKRIDGNE